MTFAVLAMQQLEEMQKKKELGPIYESNKIFIKRHELSDIKDDDEEEEEEE